MTTNVKQLFTQVKDDQFSGNKNRKVCNIAVRGANDSQNERVCIKIPRSWWVDKRHSIEFCPTETTPHRLAFILRPSESGNLGTESPDRVPGWNYEQTLHKTGAPGNCPLIGTTAASAVKLEDGSLLVMTSEPFRPVRKSGDRKKPDQKESAPTSKNSLKDKLLQAISILASVAEEL